MTTTVLIVLYLHVGKVTPEVINPGFVRLAHEESQSIHTPYFMKGFQPILQTMQKCSEGK